MQQLLDRHEAMQTDLQMAGFTVVQLTAGRGLSSARQMSSFSLPKALVQSRMGNLGGKAN